MLAYITHEATQHLAGAYLEQAWGRLAHTVLRIDAPPSVAVSAMISTDLYSSVLDAAAYVFLNVFPLRENTSPSSRTTAKKVLMHTQHTATSGKRPVTMRSTCSQN